MANFIPPFDLGQFTPSAAAITSWLYQLWKYLQDNPIPDDAEIENIVTEMLPPEVETAVEAYMQQHPISVPVTSVNGLIGAVVITYASLVTGETTPIYRASSSEITQADLLDAWNDGCRFAVVDDTTVYAILRDLDTFTLLPCGSGGGGGSGIESINTTILPDANGNALVNAANLPMAANDATTISAAIAAKTTMTAVLDKLLPVGTIVHLTVSTNPATLYGVGTWEQITGRFLLGAGANLVNTVNTFGEMAAGDIDRTAGERGGEISHTLSQGELPVIDDSFSAGANMTANSQNNPIMFNGGQNGIFTVATNTIIAAYANSNAGSFSAARIVRMKFGNNEAHNNIPPYEVVYIWKRTA